MNKFAKDFLERLKQFAIKVLEIADSLPSKPGAWALGGQVAKSAVSIPQNFAEAQAASSKRHFTTCIEISEREARETFVSLDLIARRKYLTVSIAEVLKESDEIIAMLTSIAVKSKQ